MVTILRCFDVFRGSPPRSRPRCSSRGLRQGVAGSSFQGALTQSSYFVFGCFYKSGNPFLRVDARLLQVHIHICRHMLHFYIRNIVHSAPGAKDEHDALLKEVQAESRRAREEEGSAPETPFEASGSTF